MPSLNLLLTGSPGIGKTTLIQKFLASCPMRAGGFFTHEVRERGKRVGFALEGIASGRRGMLAQRGLKSPFRVGNYGVFIKGLEEIGVAEVIEARKNGWLIVIDEIGKMELFSEAFQEALLDALDSPNALLATITEAPLPFTEKIKVRPDVEIIEINRVNRDQLLQALLNKICPSSQLKKPPERPL